MNRYVFIGAFDKADMLIYVAKALTLMGQKVVIVDTTILKKCRYIVPTMIKEKQYITSYEGIDVAIGFENFEAIYRYQDAHIGKHEEYDVALFDIDRAIAYQKFGIDRNDRHFFVTSFDVYNVKRGVQVLAYIDKAAQVTKIFYTKSMIQEEDDYVNYLARSYGIQWDTRNILFFPFETEDMNAIFVNQRAGRISMRGLSSGYKDSISFLVEEMTGEKGGKVKKIIKMIDG